MRTLLEGALEAYSLNELCDPKIVLPVLSAIKTLAVDVIPVIVSVTDSCSPFLAPILYPEISTGGLSLSSVNPNRYR